MCEDCGCSVTGQHTNPELSRKGTLEVMERILSANDRQAELNRRQLTDRGILAVNVMGSPGAGKTALLERTAEELTNRHRLGAIEGDLETGRDAERLRRKGIAAHQITTGQACHLDAFMVQEGLQHLPLEEIDILFIENVGNLVCPAVYDLGAHLNVVLLSTTEGEDKPEKYPVMFRSAQVLLLSKWDLLPHTDFDPEGAISSARKVNPSLKVVKISSKTGEGFPEWIALLEEKGSEVWKR